MIQRKIFQFLGLVLVGGVFTAFTTQDQTATRILNDVSKTYQSYKSIKAKFTISVTNNQNNSTFSQNGTLFLKGKKFRINMDDQEIYCDGKKLYTYFVGSNECQVTDYDENDQDINPSEIFTLYQNGFESKYAGEELKGGKKIAKIELTPEDKSKPYFKVKLNIDKASNKILDMTVLNKNGMVSEYEITDFSANVPISDSFFKFDEKDHPGCAVIDLTN